MPGGEPVGSRGEGAPAWVLGTVVLAALILVVLAVVFLAEFVFESSTPDDAVTASPTSGAMAIDTDTTLGVLVAPAEGGPGDNPFVGSWVADDAPVGTELRLLISNTGMFETWDEIVISGACAGGLVTSSGGGELTESNFTIAESDKRTCHPADGSDFPLPTGKGFTSVWDYDLATDTIVLTVLNRDGVPVESGTCYTRRGTDSCA